ncbi:hypothetical protein GCM10009606_45570 [Nocardioides aquiterrae]|uniref:Uncharacterized protein n=1 Tax=Nocardioides aquiterrae TaxID=203799 RepID=A0ABN1UQU9_9ACTN
MASGTRSSSPQRGQAEASTGSRDEQLGQANGSAYGMVRASPGHARRGIGTRTQITQAAGGSVAGSPSAAAASWGTYRSSRYGMLSGVTKLCAT